MKLPPNDPIRRILGDYRKIAVVGLSPNPDRPSHDVTDYMIRQGYEITGVNPGHDSILGRPCYRSIAEVPGRLEIVNVFRRSEQIPSFVDELLSLPPTRRPKVLWLQLGITHAEAEERARQAGIEVVSDACILVEHQRLGR